MGFAKLSGSLLASSDIHTERPASGIGSTEITADARQELGPGSIELARLYHELRVCILTNDQQGIKDIFAELDRAGRPLLEIMEVVKSVVRDGAANHVFATSQAVPNKSRILEFRAEARRAVADNDRQAEKKTEIAALPVSQFERDGGTGRNPLQRITTPGAEPRDPASLLPFDSQINLSAAQSHLLGSTLAVPDSPEPVSAKRAPPEHTALSAGPEQPVNLDANLGVFHRGERRARLRSAVFFSTALTAVIAIPGSGVLLFQDGGDQHDMRSAELSSSAVFTAGLPPVAALQMSHDSWSIRSAAITDEREQANPEDSAPNISQEAPLSAEVLKPIETGLAEAVSTTPLARETGAAITSTTPESPESAAPSVMIGLASDAANPAISESSGSQSVNPADPTDKPGASVALSPADLRLVEEAKPAAAAREPASPVLAEPIDALPFLEQGDRLFASRDIASARLFYEHAANLGSSKAALRLGESYDPAFLRLIRLRSVQGDPELAISWYRRARELGEGEAEILLRSIEPR